MSALASLQHVKGRPLDRSRARLAVCPFCGSPHVDAEQPRPTEPEWAIACTVCGGAGPNAETPAQAAALWNRRAGQLPGVGLHCTA